jgi:hypothetical protein
MSSGWLSNLSSSPSSATAPRNSVLRAVTAKC